MAAAAAASLALMGCPKRVTQPAGPPPPPPPPPQVSEVDLKAYHPNEAGAVLIIMYHRFDAGKPNSDMNRTPESFRKDLEELYQRNYRPIALSDFVEGKIDLPAGKSPVIFTFDDSYRTQFNYVGGQIDPDCAVGILDAFSQAHPDWARRATFFVLHGGKNPPAFYQPESADEKLAYLASSGYEVGNHTMTHRSLRSMDSAGITTELASAQKAVTDSAPGMKVTTMALPMGRAPREDDARKALLEGSADGTTYAYRVAMGAAWRPVLPPYTLDGEKPALQGQVARFHRVGLERIRTAADGKDEPGTLGFYLKFFDDNPRVRYVSGGNARVVVIPKAMKNLVDEEKVRTLGKVLQVYSPAIEPIGGPTTAAPQPTR